MKRDADLHTMVECAATDEKKEEKDRDKLGDRLEAFLKRKEEEDEATCLMEEMRKNVEAAQHKSFDLEIGKASEQVEGTYEHSQLEGLMIPFLPPIPGVGSFPRVPCSREEHAKASSGSDAGPRSSVESMKECARPGEMSDKLLRWSLEKVSSSSPPPQGKNRAVVSSRRRQDHCLRRSRTGTGAPKLEV